MPNIPNMVFDYINETTTQMMTTSKENEQGMSETSKGLLIGGVLFVAIGLTYLSVKAYRKCTGYNEYENLSKEEINSKIRMKAIEESCKNTEYEAFATVGGY